MSIFVGNLSWNTDDDSLHGFFDAEFEVAAANVQRHENSGRSKGWGLVTLANDVDTPKAIDFFNNKELDGRALIVRADRGATKRESKQNSSRDTKVAEQAGPSTKLFVGNLTWDTTSEDLEKNFADYGSLVSAEVMSKPDGRSRGWGIVEFSTTEGAGNALDNMNGAEIDGRAIKVEFQKPRTARAPRQRRERKPRQQTEFAEPSPSNSIYVGNLPWSFGDDDVFALFEGTGATSAEVKSGYDGRSRGYAIVTFDSQEDASSAIDSVNGADADGRQVVCRFDRGAPVRS